MAKCRFFNFQAGFKKSPLRISVFFLTNAAPMGKPKTYIHGNYTPVKFMPY